MLRLRSTLCFCLLVFAPGCYLAHDLDEAADAGCDPTLRPVCVVREAPCDPLRRVAPTCGEDLAWRCVESDWFEPTWAGDRCLPLALEAMRVGEAPLAVPIEGRCTWLFGNVSDASGERTNVAVELAPTCEALTLAGARSIVDAPPGVDIVSAQATLRDASGETRLLVRGWRFDASAPFGVRDLGVTFAPMRGPRLVVPRTWLFSSEVDLGDAAVAFEDHVYAYGCPGVPAWIEEDCFVSHAPLERIDDPAAWEPWNGSAWGGEPARVFGSGPHRGPVFADPRGAGFLHVYVVGFGSRIEVVRAPRPEGPWSASSVLVPCELPADDPGAYCAGPGVHLELWDPTVPGYVWISYGVGTTSPDGEERRARDPEAYWARVVRVRLP